MANAQDPHVLGSFHVAVEREKSVPAARDHELSELDVGVDEVADHGMARGDRDRIADDIDVGTDSIRILRVEVEDSLQVAERRRREDYLRHVFDLGRRAGLPSVRASR